RTAVMPRQQATTEFDVFWDRALERGVLDVGAPAPQPARATGGDWRAALAVVREDAQRAASAGSDRFELALFESIAMRDGRNANNPWLLELPDPITKVSWENVAMIAPATASKLGVSDGDVVSLA